MHEDVRGKQVVRTILEGMAHADKERWSQHCWITESLTFVRSKMFERLEGDSADSVHVQIVTSYGTPYRRVDYQHWRKWRKDSSIAFGCTRSHVRRTLMFWPLRLGTQLTIVRSRNQYVMNTCARYVNYVEFRSTRTHPRWTRKHGCQSSETTRGFHQSSTSERGSSPSTNAECSRYSGNTNVGRRKFQKFTDASTKLSSTPTFFSTQCGYWPGSMNGHKSSADSTSTTSTEWDSQ